MRSRTQVQAKREKLEFFGLNSSNSRNENHSLDKKAERQGVTVDKSELPVHFNSEN